MAPARTKPLQQPDPVLREMPRTRHAGRQRPCNLDVWLGTLPDTPARRIAQDAQVRIEAAEMRQRKRRRKDLVTFVAIVDMLIANLVRFHLRQQDEGPQVEGYRSGDLLWIGVLLAQKHLGSNDRYRRAPVPQWTRTAIIEALDALGLLVLDKAPRHADTTRPSFIRAGDALLVLMAHHKPTPSDLTTRFTVTDGWRVAGPEVIWLRDVPQVDPFTGVRRKGDWRAYQDDIWTIGARLRVHAINRWLAEAEIRYRPPADATSLPPCAIHERYLRRIFNRARFREGGRLSGGFWLTLPRTARPWLHVVTETAPDGEPFALLDFKSMFLALLYAAMAKVQPPLDRDLYEGIIGDRWPADPDRKRGLRNAIKINVNSLLFRSPQEAPRTRITRGTRRHFPKGITVHDLDRRICEAHLPIARWLRGSDIGYHLMFLESEIMVEILLRCCSAGIVALPLHDGLMVPESRWRTARSIMKQVFHDRTGFEVHVDGPKLADGESDTMFVPGSEMD